MSRAQGLAFLPGPGRSPLTRLPRLYFPVCSRHMIQRAIEAYSLRRVIGRTGSAVEIEEGGAEDE